VTYDLGEGTPVRKAISCKLMVQDGMRILDMANEISYCLRSLKLPPKEQPDSSEEGATVTDEK
jgi:hypothetical protein